jgi:hypothetical protein
MLALWTGLTTIVWNALGYDEESMDALHGRIETPNHEPDDIEAGVIDSNTSATLLRSTALSPSTTPPTPPTPPHGPVQPTPTTPTAIATATSPPSSPLPTVLSIRLVELQIYNGPTKGEILGACSAEIISTIASATGNTRDPIQMACSRIGMAAAENQTHWMNSALSTPATPATPPTPLGGKCGTTTHNFLLRPKLHVFNPMAVAIGMDKRLNGCPSNNVQMVLLMTFLFVCIANRINTR